MSETFSQTDLNKLAGLHVGRGWFLEIDLPDGWLYLHSGFGRTTIDSKEWRGVSDPLSGRLVSMNNIEEARFGQATAIQITLSGVNREFFQSVYTNRASLEGRPANLYFLTRDPETQETLISLKRVFDGLLSSPELIWENVGTRFVTITLESVWSGQNYPAVGRWSPSGQRKRYPSDRGLDLVGTKTAEQYK